MPSSLTELARLCQGLVIGKAEKTFNGVNNLKEASAACIALYSDKRYLNDLQNSSAGAILTTQALLSDCEENTFEAVIVVKNPLLALALVMQAFDQREKPAATIARSARISSSAKVGEAVHIGANVVIGKQVEIANGVELGAGVVLGDAVHIGQGSRLEANVVIYHGCQIGEVCHISAGAVIGADGFGFAETRDEKGPKWHPIPQSACVRIGDNVHIGANTTIDRGSLSDTVISDDVIIDNQIQIGHNVKIGRHTAIAACTGVAGSTHIGENCKIGGCVAIAGHITICDGVTVLGNSLITKSILKAEVYSSSMPAMPANKWRKAMAKFRLGAKISKH